MYNVGEDRKEGGVILKECRRKLGTREEKII